MKLIVFSGLPGTGKSCIAEPVGRRLGIPVFTKDRLEAALTRAGLPPDEKDFRVLRYAGYELLTTLAQRQLSLGQSAILDCVVGLDKTRRQWRRLAAAHQAGWYVIECVCSDESLHRARLADRKPDDPAWPELAWTEVERVRAYYHPWQEERLILDAVKPLSQNIQAALTYVRNREIH